MDCFSTVGTRFLELVDDGSTADGEPIYQTVRRSRVVEKFCQGLREKKFAIRGLVDGAKAGACVPKAASPAGRKTKEQGNDNDEWVPGNKPKVKKTLGAIKKASLRIVKSSSGKKDKKGKTKPAKKQKEIKIKTKGKTKDGKIKAKKKSSEPKSESATHRDGLKTPSPKKASKIKANSSSVLTQSASDGYKANSSSVLTPSASDAKTPPSSVVTTTSSSSPKTKKSGVAPRRSSASRHDAQNPWSQRYGGHHFYAYPHFPPFFHRPEHYARGGSMPLDPRYNNHTNETNLPDSETSQPATMSPPPQTLGDASLYYSVYADPRIVSPMEPDNIPNTTYWKKRIRLDNSRRNDKEILAAFMESYEDCKKYAHEMCKTHKETVVERFPVDDDAENLVRVLWPSKLRKLSVDKVSPMPVFHDSDKM